MDAERFESYARYIAEPGINAKKILEDIHGTLFLQDYDPGQWDHLRESLDRANLIIPLVHGRAVKPAKEDALSRGLDRIDAIFQAMEMCLHPSLSSMVSEALKISDNDDLIVAATHIGVSELSELFQVASEQDKKRIQFYALYLAGAQMKVLSFRTTTSMLALNLTDKVNLRMENIGIMGKFPDEKSLKRAEGIALLEGKRIRVVKEDGQDEKFIVF